MQEHIRRRPIIAIATIVSGIIVFLAALFGIWLGLYNEGFIPFAQRRGWALDMPAWYPPVLIVLGIAILVLQGSVIKALCQFVRWRQVRWLETVADEDDRDMENRIQVFRADIGDGPEAKPHLGRGEARIDFLAIIQNNTVYTLTITHLEGKCDFHKNALQAEPQHVNQSKEIKRAQRYRLKIRQYFQHGTATQILAEGHAVITGGNVAVCGTYKNRVGETKPFRIPLNDLQFEVTAG